MDQEWCLLILEEHGVGPKMHRLICHFWDEATNVCRALGNYGTPFKAGRGVTQGSPLSAKLFNIIVDVVVRKWMQLLQEEIDLEGEELDEIMETLFAIFYVDNVYIASRDPVFLQRVINGLSSFKHVDLETNTMKTQAMTCTPDNIWLQLLTKSYQQMRTEWHTSCRLGHSHSHLQRMWERHAGKRQALSDATLQIFMRSTSSRWWPKSYSTGGRVWLQSPVGAWDTQMSVPPLQGGAGKWVDDATAFS